jgi:hypothetical protein
MIESESKHYSRLERIFSAECGALLILVVGFMFYKFNIIVMTILCGFWAYAYLFYAILLKPYPTENIKYVGGRQ